MLLTRRLVAVLVFVAVLAALAVATPAAATGDAATKCAAYAVLKPGNEVPPTASKTLGAAAIHINGTTLSFAVTIANPQRETFIAGHIHVGAAGVNGPPVVTLFGGMNDRKLFFQAAQIQISERTRPPSVRTSQGTTSTTTRRRSRVGRSAAS